MVDGYDSMGARKFLDQVSVIKGPGWIAMDTDDGISLSLIDIIHVDAGAPVPSVTVIWIFFIDE
jgi:hypothetical protein